MIGKVKVKTVPPPAVCPGSGQSVNGLLFFKGKDGTAKVQCDHCLKTFFCGDVTSKDYPMKKLPDHDPNPKEYE